MILWALSRLKEQMKLNRGNFSFGLVTSLDSLNIISRGGGREMCYLPEEEGDVLSPDPRSF